jgi:hypothetical protein
MLADASPISSPNSEPESMTIHSPHLEAAEAMHVDEQVVVPTSAAVLFEPAEEEKQVKNNQRDEHKECIRQQAMTYRHKTPSATTRASRVKLRPDTSSFSQRTSSRLAALSLSNGNSSVEREQTTEEDAAEGRCNFGAEIKAADNRNNMSKRLVAQFLPRFSLVSCTDAAEQTSDQEPVSDAARAPPQKRSKITHRSAEEIAEDAFAASVAPSHGSTSLDATPTRIPLLRAPLLLPIEIVSLGISAWMRKRQSQGEASTHRDAMDDVLGDVMWQLADQLTDGERLDLREFQQARRSTSRAASAAHNARMEGERQCAIMLRMLEKLTEASGTHDGTETDELGEGVGMRTSARTRHAVQATEQVSPAAPEETGRDARTLRGLQQTSSEESNKTRPFSEMHWHVERASEHPALRQLQREWWERCTSATAQSPRAWGKLKTEEPGAKPSEQRPVTRLASQDLQDRTVEELRSLLTGMGADTASLQFAPVIKLVRSPPGAGQQMVHLDVPPGQKLHAK